MLRILSLLLLACCLVLTSVQAQETRKKKSAKITKAPPLQTSLVVDAHTGKILHTDGAHKRVYPASLAKLMTTLLAFEAIDKGIWTMDTIITTSEEASKRPPSKLGLSPGEKFTVADGINALIVKSANDVAKAMGEALAGSEDKFVAMMNAKARYLGMRNTNFTNADGWHNPNQYTNALDIAKLSLALKRDFAKYYPLMAQSSFVYKGRVVRGHNKVVASYEGVKGGKTGFHSHSGFNLAIDAARNNKRIIAVVFGGATAASRDQKMVKLLNHHFGVTELVATTAAPKKIVQLAKVQSTLKGKKQITIAAGKKRQLTKLNVASNTAKAKKSQVKKRKIKRLAA